jgi:hypothetical protein
MMNDDASRMANHKGRSLPVCGGIGLNKILLFFSSFCSVLATFYDVVPVSSFK